MKCEKCGETISGNDVYKLHDKTLCDDCYIDLVEGVQKVDTSNLPSEVQWKFHNVMKRWCRDRPNRHRIKFNSKD
jgi:hypothetical protein